MQAADNESEENSCVVACFLSTQRTRWSHPCASPRMLNITATTSAATPDTAAQTVRESSSCVTLCPAARVRAAWSLLPAFAGCATWVSPCPVAGLRAAHFSLALFGCATALTHVNDTDFETASVQASMLKALGDKSRGAASSKIAVDTGKSAEGCSSLNLATAASRQHVSAPSVRKIP